MTRENEVGAEHHEKYVEELFGMNATQTQSETDQSTDPCGRGYAKTDRSLVERKRLQSEAGTIPIKLEWTSLACRIVPDHLPKRGSLGPDLAQCEIGRTHLVPDCAALEHGEVAAAVSPV